MQEIAEAIKEVEENLEKKIGVDESTVSVSDAAVVTEVKTSTPSDVAATEATSSDK